MKAGKSLLIAGLLTVTASIAMARGDANMLRRALKLSDMERKQVVDVYATNDSAVRPDQRARKENLDNAVNIEIGDELGSARTAKKPVQTTQADKAQGTKKN